MKKPLALILLAAMTTLAFSQSGQDWQGRVMTVKGLISPDFMGITLPHEHLIIVHKFNYLDLTNEAQAIEEVGYFKAAGGKTVADASAIGIGRNPPALKRISEATGLNVLMCTGYYKDQWIHDTLKSKSIDQLTEIMVRDIIDGINGIHAGFIKIGISKPITAFEEKAVRAAAHAQLVTGVAIELHFDGDRATLAEKFHVLDALENEGVDLRRVIVDHNVPYTYLVNDFISLAERGCYVAFDMNGLEVRVLFLDERKLQETLNALIDAGYIGHLLLSQDVCFSVCYVRNGGYGYAHLLNNIVPQLKAEGISDGEIHTMMVDNPARVFPFKESVWCEVQPQLRQVKAGNGTVTFKIRSKLNWQVSESYGWLQALKSNDSTLTVTYNKNTGVIPRMAQIFLNYTGTSAVKITVKQEGAAPFIDFSPVNDSLGADAGTASYKIKSNFNWNINSVSSWMNAVRTNDSVLTIFYNKNTRIIPRTAELKLGDNSYITKELFLHQRPAAPFLNVSTQFVALSADAEGAIIPVNSNIEWIIEENAGWLGFIRVNDSTLTAICSQNISARERSCQILILGPGVQTATILISQDGAEPYFSLTPDTVMVSSDSGTEIITVHTNLEWTAGNDPGWLKPVRISDSTLAIRYERNPGASERRGDVKINDPYSEHGKILFHQSGATPYLELNPDSVSAASDSGVTIVTVHSNDEWHAGITSADWLDFRIADDTTLIVFYKKNNNKDTRHADINIEGMLVGTRLVSVTQDGAVINGTKPEYGRNTRAYPNPVKDKLTFNYPPGTAEFIEIYDSRGLLVIKTKNLHASGHTIIDLTGVEAGIYIYRIISPAGDVYTGKVVKE